MLTDKSNMQSQPTRPPKPALRIIIPPRVPRPVPRDITNNPREQSLLGLRPPMSIEEENFRNEYRRVMSMAPGPSNPGKRKVSNSEPYGEDSELPQIKRANYGQQEDGDTPMLDVNSGLTSYAANEGKAIQATVANNRAGSPTNDDKLQEAMDPLGEAIRNNEARLIAKLSGEHMEQSEGSVTLAEALKSFREKIQGLITKHPGENIVLFDGPLVLLTSTEGVKVFRDNVEVLMAKHFGQDFGQIDRHMTDAEALETFRRKVDDMNADINTFTRECFARPMTFAEGHKAFVAMSERASKTARMQTWFARCEWGLESCRMCVEAKGPGLPDDEYVIVPRDMEETTCDHIKFAIASVLLAVRDKGRKWTFGTGRRMIFGSEGFLIPLDVQHPSPHRSAHNLIAVVRPKGVEDGKLVVEIKTYDSLPDYVDQTWVYQELRNDVINCGWLNTLPEVNVWDAPVSKNVKFVGRRANVPRQPSGTNSGGLFSILNAWAVMLGIPVRKTSRHFTERYWPDDESFLKQSQGIINLAVAGCMNSGTIQAFMQASGYTEDQDPEQRVPHFTTRRMNSKRFSMAIGRAEKLDRWKMRGSQVTPEIEAIYECLARWLPPLEDPDEDAWRRNSIQEVIVKTGVDWEATCEYMFKELSPSPARSTSDTESPLPSVETDDQGTSTKSGENEHSNEASCQADTPAEGLRADSEWAGDQLAEDHPAED